MRHSLSDLEIRLYAGQARHVAGKERTVVVKNGNIVRNSKHLLIYIKVHLPSSILERELTIFL